MNTHIAPEKLIHLWTALFFACLLLASCSMEDQDDDDVEEDTTPPTVPADLTATVEKGVVHLTWTESTDDVGVKGYHIYRDGDGEEIGSSTEASFDDDEPTLWSTAQYAVSAYDARGNESDLTSPISVVVELQIMDVVGTWTGSMEVSELGQPGGSLMFDIEQDGLVEGDVTVSAYSDNILNPGTWCQSLTDTTISGQWDGMTLFLEIAPYSEYYVELYGGTITLDFIAWDEAIGVYEASVDHVNDPLNCAPNTWASGTAEASLE